VEAVELADQVPLSRPPQRRGGDVRDVRAGKRWGEAAMEAPERRAEDQAAVVLRERRAPDRGAGRQAREDAAENIVADACAWRAIEGFPLPLLRGRCDRRRRPSLLLDDLILPCLLLRLVSIVDLWLGTEDRGRLLYLRNC
jgi:hypothetical protein